MPTYIIGVKVVENRTDKEFTESIKRVTQVRTAHQGRLIASYVTFGPYDTIFAACGLLFVVAGLAAMILVRAAAPAQEGRPQQSTVPGDPGPAAAL